MADARGQPTYRGDNVPELPGYRIERQLGRGSMGVVYLAEDLQLHRKVALKILAATLADDELFRKRFERESHSVANLDHPHIVPVYAAGEAAGLLYIAMRYVSGSDLRTSLELNGPLNLQQATSIVESVADALDAAHAQGMIHRDVKPANILIDDRNNQQHYYLSDFGITKLISAGRTLTSAGQIIGTIDYIAPEQIQGKPVDGRADLYALGCVLYECLTGVVPYPREETSALMWAHMHDATPSVTALRPDLPPQIDAVVAKAIAKQPEDRYSTCRELAMALRVLEANPARSEVSALPALSPVSPAPPPPVPSGSTASYHPPTPPPVRPVADSSPSRNRKRWWLAAGVAALILAAGSTVGVMKYFSSHYPNTAEQALLGLVPQALSKNCGRNARAEQDTAHVAASLTCTSDGAAANQVTFTAFTSAGALGQGYQSAMAASGVPQGSGGQCQDAERAETAYTSPANETSGRVVCYQQRGSSFIAWTDQRDHVLARADRVDPDYMKLRDWWAGFEGLPTSAETAAAAQAQQQVQQAQQQAAAAKQQADEAQKQQAAQAQAQIDAAQKQADDAQKQAAAQAQQQAQQAQQQIQAAQQQAQQAEQQAQQQAQNNRNQNDNQNGGNQDNNNGRRGRNSRSRNQDNGNSNNNGNSDNNGSSNDSGSSNGTGNSDLGSQQNLQQMIDDAVRRALQQQGNSGGSQQDQQALRQQLEDSIRKSIQQQGGAGKVNLQQLINAAIAQAIQQAEQNGQGRR